MKFLWINAGTLDQPLLQQDHHHHGEDADVNDEGANSIVEASDDDAANGVIKADEAGDVDDADVAVDAVDAVDAVEDADVIEDAVDIVEGVEGGPGNVNRLQEREPLLGIPSRRSDPEHHDHYVHYDNDVDQDVWHADYYVHYVDHSMMAFPAEEVTLSIMIIIMIIMMIA